MAEHDGYPEPTGKERAVLNEVETAQLMEMAEWWAMCRVAVGKQAAPDPLRSALDLAWCAYVRCRTEVEADAAASAELCGSPETRH